MRPVLLFLLATVAACSPEPKAPAPPPGQKPATTAPAAPVATELDDAAVQRWLAIQEQVLDRAGVPGTDPEHRKRHQAVRDEVLKQHGTDVLGQAQVTVRINSALDLLQKRLPIPETMRVSCEVVQRHRPRIEAYVERERNAKMR